MKTLEQVASEYKSNTLDGRDMHRLAEFIPEEMLKDFGLELKEDAIGKHKHKPFTKENILAQLKEDVEFGFEKALNQRGISAGLMYEVVAMWNMILENDLADFKAYAQYGLPLFKATALLYGFDNPIGDDKGTEIKYASR